MYRQEIIYDKETHAYVMYIDGELIGFARTYKEAQTTLEQLVFDLITHKLYSKD